MTEEKTKKNRSFLDMFRSKQEDEIEMMTVREEKKSLMRIIKARPKAIKHMSEVLETDAVTEGEMKITKAVMDGVTSAPSSQKAPKVIGSAGPSNPVKSFSCLACGTKMPFDGDACPKCHAKYIHDISPTMLAELELAESTPVNDDDLDNIDELDFNGAPIIHFDAMDGVMNYLERQTDGADFVLECSNCGTLIQLDIDRCPLCGTALEASDIGLLSLIRGSDFDEESFTELECPQCGEHVTLSDGRCPSCDSVIADMAPETPARKLIPIIETENVVFIHIDLETGDMNWLQRHLNRVAIEHSTIQLDGIGNGGFDEDWQGLSRI
jgi:rubrerythrin